MSSESKDPSTQVDEDVEALKKLLDKTDETVTVPMEEDESKPNTDSAAAAAATATDSAAAKPTDSSNPPSFSDSDSDSNSTSSTSSPTPPSSDPTTLLLQATTLKEEGNTHYKSGDLSKAGRSYRQGTNLLKKLNHQNTGDEQVQSLLITLQTNLSMVCLKQNKPRQSRDLASKALDVDGTHVKALYRRAAANRKLGDCDKAKEDLKLALKYDPENREVKRELLAIRKEEAERRKREKESFKPIFKRGGGGGGGSFLYEDKEEEQRRKEEERRKKKKEEEEAKKKRKLEWEKECEERKRNQEDFITFEEWDKKRKKTEEDNQRRKREEEKAARDKELEEKKKKRNQTSEAESSESDDDMLSEKELALLRGYKKTADGRTTSYFHRDISEGEKALIGDITPQRLAANSSSSSSIPPAATAAPQPIPTSKKIESAWNAAKTWEEKDTTEWCSSSLKRHLQETRANTAFFNAILHDAKVHGDASFATSCGRKRYIFDFNVTTSFKIFLSVKKEGEEPDEENLLANGHLTLPDVSSSLVDEEEYEVNLSWKKYPEEPFTNNVKCFCRSDLVEAVRSGVKNFVNEFNTHY